MALARKVHATILLCDIRDFTTLFDDRDPIEMEHFASQVLTDLGKTVESWGGVIDSFNGDGLLAYFAAGPGGSSGESTLRACHCALELKQKTLPRINSARHLEMSPMLRMGIGIHTGEAAVVTIRTHNRVQRTILGDVVNTTCRIEGLTKHFSVDVLLSESARAQVADHYQFQKMPPSHLRGKKREVTTYWLMPTNTPPAS